MMNRLRVLLLLLFITLLLSAPVLAQLSPHFDLSWSLLSGGGGARSSANFQIDDVLGQWPDGLSSSARYQIDPGFWTKGREMPERSIFMPVLLKSRT